ncbi:hypothetical protein VIN30_07065 [Adlercreutzia sp. R7]|uniref:Uncharacterized protein n=1 Tax=Adlercreutzia wanghongyangiae TaxID=3111451 RepID=A0ABU6IIE2_9ACTN|nr:hypothetical protein [Adlercreutzia sp. R7]
MQLITADEVDVCMGETGHLISVCHHFVRENRKDASVAVGLPFHISFLLGARSALQRVQQSDLNLSAPCRIEETFRPAVEEDGCLVNAEA